MMGEGDIYDGGTGWFGGKGTSWGEICKDEGRSGFQKGDVIFSPYDEDSVEEDLLEIANLDLPSNSYLRRTSTPSRTEISTHLG